MFYDIIRKLSFFLCRNSGLSIGVFSWKSFRSNSRNIVPGVDMTLLSESLTESRLAAGVLQLISAEQLFLGKLILVYVSFSLLGAHTTGNLSIGYVFPSIGRHISPINEK